MRNFSFNLPEGGNNSTQRLRKPQFYCNRFRCFPTLEPRSSENMAISCATKIESFLKKTHNNYKILYKKSHEELLFDEAKQILSKPESHYLDLAARYHFTEWQTKLLMRDIGNLKEVLSSLPTWQHHDKPTAILKSLFRVIQEFFIQSENSKSSLRHSKQIGYVLAFLVQMNFNLRSVPHLKFINYDCLHQVQNFSPTLRKLELMIKNIQIKTTIEEYQSGEFKKHPREKLESLFFNIVDKIRNRENVSYGSHYRRILKEIDDLTALPEDSNYFIIPSSHDIRVWTAVIVGPPWSMYHGGLFYASIEIPQDYPFKPPRILLLNKILHPQIFENGKICLDVLGECFSPALTIDKIMGLLCKSLKDPDPCCFVESPAKELLDNKLNLKEIALEWVEKFA